MATRRTLSATRVEVDDYTLSSYNFRDLLGQVRVRKYGENTYILPDSWTLAS